MEPSFKDRLKDHFIPHEGNAYQPHLLRLKIAAGMLAVVVLIEALYLTSAFLVLPKSDYFAAIFAAVLVDQTNTKRLDDKLNSLTINSKLEEAARMKAEDMAAKGYFAHNSPEGKTPWYWFAQAGYDYAAAGENLAVNFVDSKDVTEAWMRSPGHRANIMNGNYTEIGIATAEGKYKGKDAIFVAQMFGRPSLIARQVELASTTVKAIGTLVDATLGMNTAPPQAEPVKPPVPPSVTPPSSQIAVPTPIIPTTTIVAGAETQRLDVPVDLSDETLVASETSDTPTRSSRWKNMLASPRQTTTMIYVALAAFLLLVLSLTIFIKVRIQHPHIIANGILLLAIVSTIVILNAMLGLTQGVI